MNGAGITTFAPSASPSSPPTAEDIIYVLGQNLICNVAPSARLSYAGDGVGEEEGEGRMSDRGKGGRREEEEGKNMK